jgi:hypothetical protein
VVRKVKVWVQALRQLPQIPLQVELLELVDWVEGEIRLPKCCFN